MKLKFVLGICLLAAVLTAAAQTTNLTALLQQGLFEEQANRNLDAAITDYQTLAAQFDKDRQLAATAIFRLGECYRAQNRTNEAAVQYQRILQEFSDQQTLATLSSQNLAGMGLAASVMAPFASSGGSPPAWFSNFIASMNHSDSSASSTDAPILDDEQGEILRIQKMIHDSPDLINAAKDGTTPLVKAAYNGWLKVAAYLLDHGANVNGIAPGSSWRNDFTQTPLIAAVAAGNLVMTKFLLAHGADASLKDAAGEIALDIAVDKGFQTVAEALIANRTAAKAPPASYFNSLVRAVQKNNLKLVQMLLAAGADVNFVNPQGFTILNYAVGFSPEITQALLNAGANPNTVSKDGRSPLSVAVENNACDEYVKQLLAAKADPNAAATTTPLLHAVHNKNTAVAERLLAAGARPNDLSLSCWSIQVGSTYYNVGNVKITPLFEAVTDANLPMVELLLKYKANPNDSQSDQRPVSFLALSEPNIMKALLDAGADPNAIANPTPGSQVLTPRMRYRRSDGVAFGAAPIQPYFSGQQSDQTLLQCAAGRNYPETVALLLERGADPNAVDGSGNSPLHEAALALADVKIFTALLDHHANPNVRDEVGQTPLEIIKTARQDTLNRPSRFATEDAKNAHADDLLALLHQRGALDNLPDWDHITFVRPADGSSEIILSKGTNDWNQFTLSEALLECWRIDRAQKFNFPDLGHLIIVRPSLDETNITRIPINFLNTNGGLDFTKDVPIQFGDAVEVPEHEHNLARPSEFLSAFQINALQTYLATQAGQAKLIVAGGETVPLRLSQYLNECAIWNVLQNGPTRTALTSNSDLSRVKVTRRDADTGKTQSWVLNCAHPDYQTAPWLIVRAGDVIEVPQKQ